MAVGGGVKARVMIIGEKCSTVIQIKMIVMVSFANAK